MRHSSVALAIVVPLLALACTAQPSPTPSPAPSGSPVPTIGPLPTPANQELSTAERKYRLLDAFSPLSYCDPDEYPVPRGDEGEKAIAALPQIQADGETFAAIVARLGLDTLTEFTADQKLAIYRQWKQLNAIALTPVDEEHAGFDLITETDPGLGEGVRTIGTIDSRGTIEIDSREATFLTGCPICLGRGTAIDTPAGPVAVEELRVGDVVWTLDAAGGRVAGTVLEVGRAPVPATHKVVRLVLDDARELSASPGHPLADGRRLGDLRPGDLVDGARVLSADLVGYGEPFTFDLLPSGRTGFYWANGILVGSTLSR